MTNPPDRARDPKRVFAQDQVSEISLPDQMGARRGSYGYKVHMAGTSTKAAGEEIAKEVSGQRNPHVRVISAKEHFEEMKDL